MKRVNPIEKIKTREKNKGKKLTESIEDYIETVYLQYQNDGKGVRITDLASEMNVTKASANDAVRKLKDLGYVEHEPYGQIFLTDTGKEIALVVYEKHCMISRFLKMTLGVSLETAEEDACAIEHVISDETFKKIKEYLKKK